jgi:predicted amidohydrolase
MKALRLGVLQMNSGEEKEANLKQAVGLIEEAVAKGANFVALPEYFNFLGRGELVPANAEPIPGPTIDLMAEQARRHGIWLHCGSIPEKVPGENRHCNTTVVINPEGEIVAKYQKIHLFDVQAGGTVYRESASVAPGDKAVVFDTPWGVMGLTICYDLRFGELHRALSLAGAQLIFQPAAFTLYTGKDHWEVLLRARAIENEVFVAAPAQIFKHPPGNACFGSAMIIDPWGTVIARAPEKTCAVVTEIDFAWLKEVREKIPVWDHRRPETYKVGDRARKGS